MSGELARRIFDQTHMRTDPTTAVILIRDLKPICGEMWREFPSVESLREILGFIDGNCIIPKDTDIINYTNQFSNTLRNEIRKREKWSGENE